MVAKWAPTESLAGWPGLSTVGLFYALQEGFTKHQASWLKNCGRSFLGAERILVLISVNELFFIMNVLLQEQLQYWKVPGTAQNSVQNFLFQAAALTCSWCTHQLLGNIMFQIGGCYGWVCSIGCKTLAPVNSVLHLEKVLVNSLGSYVLCCAWSFFQSECYRREIIPFN